MFNNTWFQGTLKHNRDLREAFTAVSSQALQVFQQDIVENEVQGSNIEKLQELSLRTRRLTALKEYAANASSALMAELDRLLQEIRAQQRDVLVQALTEQIALARQVCLNSDYEKMLQGRMADFDLINECVSDELAEECGIEQAEQSVIERTTFLHNVEHATHTLMKSNGVSARVLAAAASGVNPIDDFDSFMKTLETLYTYLNEIPTGMRPLNAADVQCSNAMHLVLDALRHNGGFGAAIGRENFEKLAIFADRFMALQPHLQMPNTAHSSDL